jgi:hypothetical protein
MRAGTAVEVGRNYGAAEALPGKESPNKMDLVKQHEEGSSFGLRALQEEDPLGTDFGKVPIYIHTYMHACIHTYTRYVRVFSSFFFKWSICVSST